jgi:hypothetical protein
MNKLIGFLITKNKPNFDLDFLKKKNTLIIIRKFGFNIYLWGIGDIKTCTVNQKYCFSFPLNTSLLDRNIVISFKKNCIYVENDWLGSIPIFYNKKNFIVSTISNFCKTDKIICKEGLFNFCSVGYSVHEQTIFENVKFLRYLSKIVINNREIKINCKPDILDRIKKKSEVSEKKVFIDIKKYIKDYEKITSGNIIIPTSGGYDSRLLNCLVEDKSRILSFSYGVSKIQKESFEVIYAKKLSQHLKINWQQIKLSKYYKKINEWFQIFGFSVHLHGMHYYSFFEKILVKMQLKKAIVLSGICGDIWSGNHVISRINNYKNLGKLYLNHGMHLPTKYLNIKENYTQRKIFYNLNKCSLNNEKIRLVFLVRFKIILLHYLISVPEYLGKITFSPFLNFNIANNILNINKKKRKNREWQKNFFKKNDIYFENLNIYAKKTNNLDFSAAVHSRFKKINIKLMSAYFSIKFLKRINNRINNITKVDHLFENMNEFLRRSGQFFKKFFFKKNYSNILNEYLIIKTIEKSIK